MTRAARLDADLAQRVTTEAGMGPEVDDAARKTQAWERDCIERCRAGDTRAFGELLGEYQSRVFSLIARWVSRRDEAHELTQETFLIAYREQGRFDVSRPFRPWLFKIAVNVCRNHLRRHARREQSQPVGGYATGMWSLESGGPESDASAIEDSHRVLTALHRLSADDRGILLLRFREDMSYAELAVVMRRPKALLKVRVHRALKRLRQALEAP